MQKEYPDVKIPSLLVYKALHESAVPMEGYTPLDQGGGLININNAYKLLKKYIDEGEIDKFETYTISSFAPNTPSGSAPNLYIRNGSYLDGKETFSYRIRRNNFNKKDKFYRTYNIKSDSDWLIPITKNTYIRNSQATGVSVRIDPSILSRPGLYCGRIKAYRADKTKFPEFEMLATIVIPEHFNESNNYELSFEGDLAPAAVKRYFLNIPAGATAMKVNLSYDKGEYSNTWYSLHDPAGRGVSTIRPLESEKNEKEDTEIYYDLLPGVYELDVVGYYRATDTVDYNLNVKFLSIEKAGDVTITDDDNTVAVVDRYTNTERYNLGGKLLGYEKNYKEVINQPVYKKPFTLKRSEKEKTFNLTVSGEDFNKVTDFAVQIIDEDGKIVSSNGFSYDNMSISINNSYDNDEVNLILQYVPAYVDEPKEITVYVNEITDLKEPVTLDVRNKGNDSIVLYPSVVEDIEVNYEKPELDFPEDSVPYGKIIFESPETGDTEYELPIYFNL